MSTSKQTKPVIRKSTPTVVKAASELVEGNFIRTNSGRVVEVTSCRKRGGVVRLSLNKQAVMDVPRAAEVTVFDV